MPGPFLSICFAASIAVFAPSEDLLQKVIHLLQQGNYSEALLVLDQFKQSAPKDARPYFYSAVALAEAGQSVLALAELRKALQLDPGRADYHLLYADILSRTGEISDVVETLDALGKDSFLAQLDAEGLWRLAEILYRVERFEDAARVLNRYQEKRPGDGRSAVRKGQIALVMGRFQAAAQAFREALDSLQEVKAPAHYGLGVALFMQNDLPGAKEALLKALKEEPRNPEYVDQLGTVLLALGDFESALSYLRSVEAEGERLPRIYDNLGKACRGLGRLAEAKAYFEKFRAVEQRRRQENTRQERTRIVLKEAKQLLDSGRVAQARLKFSQALQLEPDNWLAHSYLAKIYLSSGQSHQAYQQLRRMEEIDPDAFEGKYLMALLFYEQEQSREALRYAEEAKKRHPGYAELRNLLGNIYRSLGMREKALQEYGAALSLEPDRADFRLNYESLKNN